MLVLSGSQVAPYTFPTFKVGGETRQYQITVIGSSLDLEFQQWSGTYNRSDLAFQPPTGEFVLAASFSGSGGTFIASGIFDFVRFKLNSGTATRIYYREVQSSDLLPESGGVAAFVADSSAVDISGVNTKINEILAALKSAGLMEGS